MTRKRLGTESRPVGPSSRSHQKPIGARHDTKPYVPPDPYEVIRDLELGPFLSFAVNSLPPPPSRILDVGCGDGYLALALHNRGFEVLAIDEDAEMVAAVNAKGIRAIQASYPHGIDPRFDGILFSQSIHHTHDSDELVEATHKLLSPGGVLLVDDVCSPELTAKGRNFLSETLGVLEKVGIVSHMFVENKRWPERGPFDNWEVYFEGGERPNETGEDTLAKFANRFNVQEVLRGPFLFRLTLPFLPRTDLGVDLARAIIYVEKQRIQDGSLPELALTWRATPRAA